MAKINLDEIYFWIAITFIIILLISFFLKGG